jgi:putative CocE/NonD family hydrolase
MSKAIDVTETIWIHLPDGTRLAARLWLPHGAAETPVPALVEYIPYRRRDRTRLRDESLHPGLAARGYASLRIDMRGTGDSDGVMTDEYTEQEIQDGVDTIAWIADQPWCSGAVGMFGKSWGAFTAFQIAARRPPALKAIVPVMGTDDRFSEDIHFYGGVMGTDNFWWGAIMQLLNAMPPDPAIVGQDRWRDIWRTRLEAMTFWPAEWSRHQTRDAFWKHGSICEDYGAVDIPVLYVGGWADLYRNTAFRIAEHLPGPVSVIMGPWAHLYPHEGSPAPKIDFIAEAAAFFDRHLRGDGDDAPSLRFWMQTGPQQDEVSPGHWIAEPGWPSPNVANSTFWLNAGTLDDTARPTDALMTGATRQTFGASGGDMCSFAIPGDLPSDGRQDSAGALAFRSEPLEDALEILGAGAVQLTLATNQSKAFVVALLYDEAPEGDQHLVARGFANLMHRNGNDHSVPVPPGEEVSVTVTLNAAARRIVPGHRLMLKIASTYWPALWPAPEPVTLTLRPGDSSLTLPIRRVLSEGDPRALPEPPLSAPPAMTTLREGSMERTLTTDPDTGIETHRLYIDGGVFGPVGKIRLDEIGTELADISERIYQIHPDEPLSARAVMRQEAGFHRDDWSVRIVTQAEMTASAEAFHFTASVACFDGDSLFFEVAWDDTVPRTAM